MPHDAVYEHRLKMGGMDNRSVKVVVLFALGCERLDGIDATAMALARLATRGERRRR